MKLDFTTNESVLTPSSYPENSHKPPKQTAKKPKIFTIGITGVGGGVGQSIIKALQHTDYKLIGMDGEALGTGLFAVEKAYKIPYALDPTYVEQLLNICRVNGIELLFPGLDAELEILAKNKKRFLEIGTTVMVSDMDIIDIAENKWLTFERLTTLGFNVPLTFKISDLPHLSKTGKILRGGLPLNFPFIVKPFIGGARSKDVFLVKNEADFQAVLAEIESKKDRFVIQEYLVGEEFTCGTVTLDGNCFGAIVMERELRSGDTYKCFAVDKPDINQYLIKLMNTLRPFGACNVQLKLKNGVPYIFEINARCSGTTAARALCGFNEPMMVADFYLKGKMPIFEVQQKTILRYWKELVVETAQVETLKRDGSISREKGQML
jgi:carbamoyl-phosphate synthase large subunit